MSNIGAGKTTFAVVAEHLGGDLPLEQFQENPFGEVYADPERLALSVELPCRDRYRQLAKDWVRIFRQLLIADYSFVKSKIFAKANLPAEEFRLFQTMFKLMDAQIAAGSGSHPRSERGENPTVIKRRRSYEQDMPQNTSTKSPTTTNDITGTRADPASFGSIRLTSILSSARATRNVGRTRPDAPKPGVYELKA